MRAPLLFRSVGESVGAEYLVEVLATVYRDYYLRISEAAGTYTVDVYATLSDAEAQTSRLATGTHAVGGPHVVVLTPDGGAPFAATPMTVVVQAGGTWTTRIIGWVAGVQAALLARIGDILEQYAQPDEVLDGLAFGGISLNLPQRLPCYGFGPMPTFTARFDTNRFQSRIAVKLFAAFEGVKPATVIRCTSIGEALRSIALDEQQTWGGFAMTTTAAGALEPAVDDDNGDIVFSSSQVVLIDVPELVAERDPASLVPSTGGKYVVGL